MNAIFKRIALIASLFAVTLATGCVSLSVDGDGYGVADNGGPDILAAMAKDSEAGGE
ncbi:MAG: hypothetical protein OEX21_07265 [Betaproteobacteria bacterium]|nr:hypothetical protein [Betaproteobacteria bacterium]